MFFSKGYSYCICGHLLEAAVHVAHVTRFDHCEYWGEMSCVILCVVGVVQNCVHCMFSICLLLSSTGFNF